MNSLNIKYPRKSFASLLLFTLVYFFACGIYYLDNIVSGLILIINAFVLLLYHIKKRNSIVDVWLIFRVVWSITQGLSMFRMCGYQKEWKFVTFVLIFIGIVFLFCGLYLSSFIKVRRISAKGSKKKSYKESRKYLKRIYNIVIIATFISVVCFVLSSLKTGFIALFSNSVTAYNDKYTKFVVFEIAMAPSAILAYYYIKQSNNKFKKFAMISCILIHVIILPVLNVSRGNMLTSIMIMVPIVLSSLKKKELKRIFIVVILVAIAFMIATYGRGYSDAALNYYFQPKAVDFFGTKVKLSPTASFIYSYLTVSHDNFNYNIIKSRFIYGYGSETLKPFNVIMRLPFIKEMINTSESSILRISVGLNTNNMIAMCYYDLGLFGIVFLMFVYGFIFGYFEKAYRKLRTPFAIALYGCCIMAVGLSFFSNWIMLFEWWLWVGTILLFSLFRYNCSYTNIPVIYTDLYMKRRIVKKRKDNKQLKVV